MRLRHRLSVIAAIVFAALAGQTSERVWGQEATPEETPAAVVEPIGQQDIQQRIDALGGSTLEEPAKQKATDFYQKALEAFTTLEQQRELEKKFAARIQAFEGAAGQQSSLQAAKDDLAAFPAEPAPIDFEADLGKLESQLAGFEQDVLEKRERLTKAEAEPKTRSARLAEIPQLMIAAQQELDQIEERLEQLPAVETTDLVGSAERIYLINHELALKAMLQAMEKERQFYAMSPELVQVRRDLRAKELAVAEKKLETVRQEANRRRVATAKQQARAAVRDAAVERPAAIAKLADSNAELAKQQSLVAAKIGELNGQLKTSAEKLDEIKKEYTRSKTRVEDAGLTEASGQQLREQRGNLPDTKKLQKSIAQLTNEKAAATYQIYKLQDDRAAIVDADVQQRIDEILAQVSEEQRGDAEKKVRSLLQAEQDIYDSAISTYGSYKEALTKLLATQTLLAAETEEYTEFIAEHVLWVRSCSPPRLADKKPLMDGLRWSLSPGNWRDAGVALAKRTRNAPLVTGLILVCIVGLAYVQQRMRRRLREIGELVVKRTHAEFLPSLQAAGLTLAMSLPWPALLWFSGWWMEGAGSDSEFVNALASSLQFTAGCLFLLELVRHLCRSGGLADAHFGWMQSCLLQVRRNVRWLIGLGLPLILWIVGLKLQNVQNLWSSTLGRLCFVLVMLQLGIVLHRVLLSRNSPFRQLIIANSGNNPLSLRKLWCPALVVLPILLAAMALVGYYYTAQQLALRLLLMVGLVFLLLTAGGLTKRWILVNRRRLAREQAKQKRAQALAAAESAAAASGEESVVAPPPELVEDSVDLVALGEQTNRLVQTILVAIGLVLTWFVWKEMLPALAYVGQREVFPGLEGVGERLRWGQVVAFLVICGVSFVVVRNVPALLEFVVLQRLPLDSGLRYAITSICRYLLLAVGIYVAYRSLGFDGTSIQWLIAAMGVGLGFGLQEIFANFVSGVILLFERPLRLGDIVTLGDTTGVVTRIRMRSTTIVDWDRKEYIVPNKDLVTERLLNWTLSDNTNRIVINVGVAYGSNTDLACRLLKEVAQEHPVVLDDPATIVTFEGFGNSTLNLVMRCYLPNLDNRLLTIHELHTAIDRKFREADIEIAFPQTDLHVRTVPPEWLRLDHKHGAKEPASNGQSSAEPATSEAN